MFFKHKRGASRVLVMASVATSAISFPAMAQEAPSSKEIVGLEDIIVQARKVSENLQDVPVAVTVLSGEDLTDRNVQRVQDIANFTPGFSLRQGSNTPSALILTLRGQVQSDTLITLDPSVGTYVDGVYWARSYGLNGDFLDIQSAQILKGPQGTLFGRNTTGGALLLNSNNPDLNDFGGSLSLTYGRFNEFQATGVLNVPIVEDKVGLRIAAQRSRRDGYTTNVVPAGAVSAVRANNPAVAQAPYVGTPNGVKLDNRDRWTGRAKLDIKPTDNLTLRFSGEYFEMDEQGPARQARMALAPFVASNSTYSLANTGALFVGLINGSPPATAGAAGLAILNPIIANLEANPKIASNNEVPYAYTKTQTYGFTGILDTSFGQMQLITGYRKIDAHAGVDLDGTPFAIHFTESQQSVEQLSGEFQVTGVAFNDTLDFAAGFFAFHENGFDQSISIVAPAINPVTSHFFANIDNDSMGGYGQATYHFNDKLSFTGGLRYSVDDKGITSLNNNYNTVTSTATCSLFAAPPIVGPEVVALPQCAVTRRDSFSGWSYTAGLEYKPTDDLLFYIKTGKGFRSGGQNLRAPSAAFLIPFKPEIAYSHEIGFKGEFLDRRVRLNLAAYQTDIKDIQRTTLIAQPGANQGASATVLGNAGKARFRGFEAETVVSLADGLRFSGFIAHVDPKYIRYSDLSGDRSFERFDAVVPWQWGAALDFDRDLGGARLKLHADYSHFSDSPSGSYFFPQNAAQVPAGSLAVPGAINAQNAALAAVLTRDAQDLFGARASVSFADDAYELAVFVRNITNDRTYTANLLVAPVGYVSSTRNEPRTFGVTGTFRF